MVDRQLERRASLAVFCFCLLSYGYFIYRGEHHNPDSRLALTYSIVEQGTLTIDRYATQTLDRAYRHGHYYSDKAPGLSLLLAPLYFVLRPILEPLAAIEAGDRFLSRYLLTFLGLGMPAAGFCAWLLHWLRRFELGLRFRIAVIMAYAVGSPAYPFSIAAFGHVPAGMALFGAFAAISGKGTGDHGSGAIAGALLALAFALEYPAALPAIAIAAYAVARAGNMWFSAAALAFGALPVLAMVAVYHALAFGAPWRVGYALLDPAAPYARAQAQGLFGVGWPDVRVLVALLVGEKRGLLLYAPWVLLSLPGAWLWWRRGRRAETALVVAVFGGLLLVNAGYAVWDGGASWGPRHLVPALPFIALMALPTASRWPLTAALLVAGSVVLTWSGVASLGLSSPEVESPLRDALLPRVV
ncbi:MAG TPA: hypothetical protein VGW38_06585, partial [Chloroflexota bacterium]|nr:hypothetical protein [Chloroflexota bacterium]